MKNDSGKKIRLSFRCTPPEARAFPARVRLELYVGAVSYTHLDVYKRQMLGYLPQEFGYYPDFTVKDYLMYIASIKGLRPATAKKRVKALLARTGLTKAADKKMKKLSGGMKRRAGIAQALLNNPEILILDEPTAGLDPGERVRFRNLISEIAEDRLVLLSTHIVSDVEYIAKEILLMKEGKIAHAGTAEELIGAMPQRVWLCRAEKNRVPELTRRYQVANIKMCIRDRRRIWEVIRLPSPWLPVRRRG